MPRCLISLGANLGDPLASMKQALYWLRKSFGEASVKASRLYRTPAVGGPQDQQEFLNAIVAVETNLSPWDVWHIIRDIESQMGRTRNLRWEARAIDIDVLLYEHERIWTPHFKVPHPRMSMRRFVLEPALEVAADWTEPVSGWSLERLFQHLTQSAPSILLCGEALHGVLGIAQEAAEQLALPPTQSLAFAQGSLSSMDRSLPWFFALPWSEVTPSLCIPAIDALKLQHDLPKLLVIAAAPPADIDVAWEDWLRCWADALGMRSSAATKLKWDGPRYLLPLQDRQWAVHELVAAVQAMQCPVEPID